MRSDRQQYSEDLFADSRMSFGDHLEELRAALIRAFKGLFYCVAASFILDGIGLALGWPWLGIGYPMVEVIKHPVQEQLRAFNERRFKATLKDADNTGSAASAASEPRKMKIGFSPADLADLRGQPPPNDDSGERKWITAYVSPKDIVEATQPLDALANRRDELSVLSVQEGMVVYLKVSLVCGLVLASPWVFWQIWSFVAAGLYPHEKHYVHKYLPMSLGLFLAGVVMCQFVIIPRSIAALLWFNEWLGLKPELRLNEWLSFAILMPVFCGVCFQTPLVMLFLERVGIFTHEDFRSKRRMAILIMVIAAAILTPGPDVFSQLALAVPMVGLYELGLILIKSNKKAPAHAMS
jgi:sec-independent protein translocase protein TatC